MNEQLSPLDAAELNLRNRIARARKAAIKVVTSDLCLGQVYDRALEGSRSAKNGGAKTHESRERLAALALSLAMLESDAEKGIYWC